MTLYGFRIVGSCAGGRKLVDWTRAFSSYCNMTVPGGGGEAYLSAFTFGDGFRRHLTETGTTKGYESETGSSWLWFDIDRAEADGGIEAAVLDTRALCLGITLEFSITKDAILVFYSGAKGFHVGLPLGGFAPTPHALFHRVARRVAESISQNVEVSIDCGIYDRVRAFRAPNSRHPKTGRYKRRLTFDEMLYTSAARIVALAENPKAFAVADIADPQCDFELPALWNRTHQDIAREEDHYALERERFAAQGEGGGLNRLTLDFIRNGAIPSTRHRRLYSAAKNLAEHGAPRQLCQVLLREIALDSGLSPNEVDRQIQCGYEAVAKGGAA